MPSKSPPSEQHSFTNYPRQLCSLGISGRSVEKLSVEKSLAAGFSVGSRGKSVHSARRTTPDHQLRWCGWCQKQWYLGLGVQELLGAGQLSGTHAGECRDGEKCQAANRGIAEQYNPGGKRERCRSRNCQQSDGRRNQNHSCKHLPYPLRELHGKGAGRAWQHYDLDLVNLRRMKPAGSAKIREATRPDRGAFFWTSDFRAGGNNDPDNRSRRMLRCVVSTGSAGAAAGLFRASRGLRDGWVPVRETPTSREQARRARVPKPELLQECLSFVIPKQQGSAVIQGESK
jgi:hypothetical protein